MTKPCSNIIISKGKEKVTTYDKCALKDRPCITPYKKDETQINLDHTEIVFIAEAPGYLEAIQKRYMVGQSGQKLKQTLSAIGLTPNMYTILNSVLCHPDQNETPSKTTLKLCNPILGGYLNQIKPKFVVLLGNPAIYAFNMLYDTKINKVSEARGEIFEVNDYKVLCTFHPSYILRNSGTSIEQLWVGDLQHLYNALNNKLTQNNNTGCNKILVDTPDKFSKAIEDISKNSLITIDIETTGLEYTCDILCISIYAPDNKNAYCFFIDILKDTNLLKIKEIIENQNINKIGQNLKFDILHLKKLGIEMQGVKDDTMLLHFLKSGMQTKGDVKHSLDKIGWELGCPITIPEIDYSNIKHIDKEKLADYAMSDVIVTHWVYKKLKFIPTPTPTHKEFIEKMSEKLADISVMLADIEDKGIKFDLEALNKVKQDTETQLKESEKALFDFVGKPFNLKSSKQVTDIINIYNIPIVEKTEKKQYISTEMEVLERYKEYPIIQKFINAKKPKDYLTYFIDPVILKLQETSIYHPTFNLHTTRTGRTSSGSGKKSINLQNIDPIFRHLIIPKLDKLLKFDYSQIEFRVMAYLSKDEKMLDVFRNNIDLHKYNASIFFDKSYNDITKEERYFAKQKGFKVFYGGQAKSLAKELNCSIEEAERKANAISYAYSTLKKWGENQFIIAKNYGYSCIPSGRLRIFTNLEKENYYELKKLCFNTPPQGYASDITITHARRLHLWLKENKFKSHIINLVHDEILLDCIENEIEQIIEAGKIILVNGEGLMPKDLLKVEYKIMKNWADV